MKPRPRATGLLLFGLLGAGGIAAMPLDLGPLSSEDEEAELVAEPDEPADPLEELDTTVDVEDWKSLADCESGEWDIAGEPQADTRRWDYGLEFDHGDIFQGGLNFHPQTWDAYRDPDMPAHAGRAEPVEEIEVAERVLDDQGWEAWPVCSRMMDLAE